MFKGLIKLFLILNSNQKPWQIAGAAAMGFLLACVPGGNLLWIALLILLLILRVNRAVGLLFMVLFRLFAPFYDGMLDRIGYAVLTTERLVPLWTELYNLPLVPYTSFNDTLVMGGLLTGLAMFVPIMLIFRILVKVYRNKIAPKWQESKLYKKLHTLPWFNKLATVLDGGAKAFKVVRS